MKYIAFVGASRETCRHFAARVAEKLCGEGIPSLPFHYKPSPDFPSDPLLRRSMPRCNDGDLCFPFRRVRRWYL